MPPIWSGSCWRRGGMSPPSPSVTTGSTWGVSTISTRPIATWPRDSLTSVGVIGLGYVGLTLAVSLARKGFKVYGVDTSPRVLEALSAGRSHLFEPGVEEALHDLIDDRRSEEHTSELQSL